MRVIQVCVGRSRAARIGDRSFMTAFAKRAVGWAWRATNRPT